MQFFQNRIKKKAEIRETHFPSQFGFVRFVGLQVITQLRSSRNQPPEASASVLMEELISIKKSGRDLCYFFGIVYRSAAPTRPIHVDAVCPFSARILPIDIDASMLSLRYPAEENMNGDAADTLKALLPLIRRKDDRDWSNFSDSTSMRT
jgi:thiamine pyrophosphate-dependent acetolactate synthase large subunit-like protein